MCGGKMLEKQYNGIRWFEFELFADCPIVHGCLMRHGGVSTGELDSLNLGRHRGDDPRHVNINFQRVQEALLIPAIVSAKIIHGNKVSEIVSANTEISDGLMTKTPELGICVSQADCQGAIFYDPKNHKLAVVHSGWRSNVLNIYGETVEAMKGAYGSNPSDLLVGISPSLGPDSSEFLNYKEEFPESFWQFQVKPFHFDLWAISEWQLRNSGVLPHHIQIAKIDTKTSLDFFSFRRSKHCGRNGTIAMLKK